MTIPESRLLTVDDLSQMFSVQPATIREWAREGRLPTPITLTQRTLRWSPQSISELLQGFGVHPVPGHPGAVSGSER